MPTISSVGLEQLIAEEGEVLRAYRDVAGVWTIGVGLTAASGVVIPKAGMELTRAESRALLARALADRYEPAVAAAMPAAKAHEFDGGVSFHFNTGAIGRASWVRAWRRDERSAARAGLAAWNKVGGRVVAGLSQRRCREADLILDGRRATLSEPFAVLKRGDNGDQVRALQADLVRLGVLPQPADGLFGAATEAAVRLFQSAHPQLLVDGRVGPATRAQMARALTAQGTMIATAAGGTLAAGSLVVAEWTAPKEVSVPAGSAVVILVLLVLAALGLLAWGYRDEIRAVITLKRNR